MKYGQELLDLVNYAASKNEEFNNLFFDIVFGMHYDQDYYLTDGYKPCDEGIEIHFYQKLDMGRSQSIAKVLYRPHELKNQAGELWIDQEIQNLSKIAETKNKIAELKEQIKKLEETL
jgi:hypothetical protein